MEDLNLQLSNLATTIGNDVQDLRQTRGDLNKLKTTHKSTLVGALNELFERPSGSGGGGTGVPSDVRNAVKSALADPDFVRLLLDARAESLKNSVTQTLRLAAEVGTYYLEDAFDEDERTKIMSGHYLTNEDPNVNHAVKIQEFINKIPNGSLIKAYRGSWFQLAKNRGYKPETFGADGRNINKGGFPLVVDGLQPCVFIHGKQDLVFDFTGAGFIVDKLGQTAFMLGTEGSKNHTIVHTGKVRTRPYLKVGYVGGRTGLFPPIDRWSAEKPWEGSGFAAKGAAEVGFNTTVFRHELSTYDNNCANTNTIYTKDKTKTYTDMRARSHDYQSAGGYFGDGDPLKSSTPNQFPQDDGTVAETWGTWRGAHFGGDYGNAWQINGDEGTTIHYFDVAGFMGDAVLYGRLGQLNGEQFSPNDEEGAKERNLVAINQTILGGTAHGHYVGYVGVQRGINISVSGVKCPNSKCGHPDWHPQHSRFETGESIDPGYGFHTSRYMPMNNITVFNNDFGECARKVIDAHCGNNFRIFNNKGYGGNFGVSIVIEERFAGTDNNGPSASNYLHESVFDISNNFFTSAVIGIHLNNGSEGIGKRKKEIANGTVGAWWLRGRVRVKDNTVRAPSGLTYNYGHNGFTIDGNDFMFRTPKGDPYGACHINAITVTNGGSGYTTPPEVIIEGGGPAARHVRARALIGDGQVKSVVIEKRGTGFVNVPTVRFEGGEGTGATATATIRQIFIGMVFGDDTGKGRGPGLGDIITNNRVANSREGNYSYSFTFGDLKGASIFGNRADVTPYTKVSENFGKPYVSENPYNSGIDSVGFRWFGKNLGSYYVNNATLNQLTEAVTFEKPTDPSPGAGSTSSGDSSSAAGKLGALRMKFDMTDVVGHNVFSNADTSISPYPGTLKYTPKDFTDFISTDQSIKVIHAKLLNEQATVGITPYLNAPFDGSVSTVILPIKIDSFGKNKVSTLLGYGTEAYGLLSTADNNTFAVKSPLYVNGSIKQVSDNVQLEKNKWYVLAIKAHIAGDYLVFGGNQIGNNSMNAVFGEGILVYRGIDLSDRQIYDIVNSEAYKTKYAIEVAAEAPHEAPITSGATNGGTANGGSSSDSNGSTPGGSGPAPVIPPAAPGTVLSLYREGGTELKPHRAVIANSRFDPKIEILHNQSEPHYFSSKVFNNQTTIGTHAEISEMPIPVHSAGHIVVAPVRLHGLGRNNVGFVMGATTEGNGGAFTVGKSKAGHFSFMKADTVRMNGQTPLDDIPPNKWFIASFIARTNGDKVNLGTGYNSNNTATVDVGTDLKVFINVTNLNDPAVTAEVQKQMEKWRSLIE